MADNNNNTDIAALLQMSGNTMDNFNNISPKQQAALTILLGKYQKNASNNMPLPDTLSKKEMNKLWKEAENDPTINNYYADQLNQAKSVMNMSYATDTQGFQLATTEQQQKYVSDMQNLNATAAKSGQLYSGIRGQAKQAINNENSDTLQSTSAQYEDELNQLGQKFEQDWGTGALQNTALAKPYVAGNIDSYMGNPYTGASTTPVGYTPIGNVVGNQVSNELSDKIQDQQDLAQQQIQGKQLKNVNSTMLPPKSD